MFDRKPELNNVRYNMKLYWSFVVFPCGKLDGIHLTDINSLTVKYSFVKQAASIQNNGSKMFLNLN